LEVKLRDKRRPGHCWQDNELYDVFQPIVGAQAVSVYVNLTRDCYGETRVSYTLRKLADAMSVSRAAVWRNLAVLESVGVLRLIRGKGSGESSCELCDLKDAAEALGGVYNSRRSSFVLPEEKLAELRARVASVRESMQGKRQPEAVPVCVSQRDANSEESLAAPESRRDANGAGRDASVSLLAAAIDLCKEEEKECPPTPQRGVEEKPAAPRRLATPIDAAAFSRFRLKLKQELCDAMPLGKQQHMPTLVPGAEDFDSCFRDWWFVAFRPRGPGEPWLVETDSPDPELTRRGLEKYRQRVERLMVRHFGAIVQVRVVAAEAVK
jgi:hypothetical protein